MRIFLGVTIFILAIMVVIVVVNQSGINLRDYIPGMSNRVTVYVDQTPFRVGIADTQPLRQQGLSGTEQLDSDEGLLFVFEEEGLYGFWMKDMNYPIDILWFDESLSLVHIERNVSPDTFPTSFVSDEPARFVLELNAFVAESFNIDEGATLTLPSSAIPADLRRSLQQ